MDAFLPAAITGVILAGGQAQRMGGQDKGLLLLGGLPLIAHAIRAIRPQVGELFISANRHFSAYRAFGYPVVSDPIGQFYGPLAGMLAAMTATNTPYVLSTPCDSPLLPADYARRMFAALTEADADLSVACDGERLQPVFALLRRELCTSLQSYLEGGERKVDRWFGHHRFAETDFSDQPTMFRNINTPAELAALETELNRWKE